MNGTVIASRRRVVGDMLVFEPGAEVANILGYHGGDCVCNFALTREQAAQFADLLADWCREATHP